VQASSEAVFRPVATSSLGSVIGFPTTASAGGVGGASSLASRVQREYAKRYHPRENSGEFGRYARAGTRGKGLPGRGGGQAAEMDHAFALSDTAGRPLAKLVGRT
jgi:hypothetical protein